MALLTSEVDSGWRFVMMHCYDCDKYLKLMISIQDDKITCSTCDGNLRYQCRKCKKLWDNVKIFWCHLKNGCNLDAKFTCDQCEYKTDIKCNLSQHIQFKHLNSGKVYKCSKCPKTFKHALLLSRHEKRCGKDRSIMCTKCDYKTSCDINLYKHNQYKHSISTSHKCNTCNKSFDTFVQRQMHKNYCEKEATISCDQCNYKARRKQDLDRHKKTHLNPTKPHKCSSCARAFKTEDERRRHVKKSCGKGREFSCYHCRYKTIQKGNLARHVRQKHLNFKEQSQRVE